jgi:hypothetical protein
MRSDALQRFLACGAFINQPIKQLDSERTLLGVLPQDPISTDLSNLIKKVLSTTHSLLVIFLADVGGNLSCGELEKNTIYLGSFCFPGNIKDL